MAPVLLPPIDIRSRSQQYTERSEGLHLSDITGYILLNIDRDKYGSDDEGKWMNFLLGLIYERALELAWLDKEIEGNYREGLIRPGEFRRDGIIGTPDAFDASYSVFSPLVGRHLYGRPEEFKCTKKTLRTPITDRKFWIYWVQLKAYAYMMDCNSGVLRILHINGNYSYDDNDPNAGYVIQSWEDTWTDLELQENWMMLLKNAVRMGKMTRDDYTAAAIRMAA